MSKSRKYLYKQIYNVTYIANINKMINETRYIDMLQKLSMEGFKTYHIDNFDKLTMHLQSIGLNDSFNISMLMYLRDTNYKKMSEISILFNDIGKVFTVKKNKMVERMHNIKKILKQKLNMIRSFKKFDQISNFTIMENDDNIIKNKENSGIFHNIYQMFTHNDTTQISQRESVWMSHTRTDIIDRLHLLAIKHFTIDQLRYMNVELKYVSEINNMSYPLLEQYYFKVVNQLDKILKEWITICRMYIDIEVNYVECCENVINEKKTHLNLKHFSVNIKNH